MDIAEAIQRDPKRASGDLAPRLLSELRERLGSEELSFLEPLEFLGRGSDAWVYAFRLAGATPELDDALVLRVMNPRLDPRQLAWEEALHSGLGRVGFPVPRILISEADPAPLGARFQVMSRVPGRMLLEDLVSTPIEELVRRPLRLVRALGQALGSVPRLLAETQARLHDLDPEPVERELLARGFTAAEYGEEGRLLETQQRVASGGLEGLSPAVRWLDETRPPRGRPVICHSDLLFTNLYVAGGRVTGVFDWSKATLADPAYDVAATLARLDSGLPGLPAPLRPVQAFVQRRYLALYRRRRPLDVRAVRYYEAAWVLYELLWGIERRLEGRAPTPDIRDRWMHPEVMARGLRRLTELTGCKLWLPPSLGVDALRGRGARRTSRR